MRGNEFCRMRSSVSSSTSFSIPMRGNELDVDGQAGEALGEVFDPHEG